MKYDILSETIAKNHSHEKLKEFARMAGSKIGKTRTETAHNFLNYLVTPQSSKNKIRNDRDNACANVTPNLDALNNAYNIAQNYSVQNPYPGGFKQFLSDKFGYVDYILLALHPDLYCGFYAGYVNGLHHVGN